MAPVPAFVLVLALVLVAAACRGGEGSSTGPGARRRPAATRGVAPPGDPAPGTRAGHGAHGDHAGRPGARPAGRPVDGAANAELVATGGQFSVSCGFSHRAPDDPIVHPGRPGASHLHDFFGNASTDAASTASTLARAPTTCGTVQDRAAYWAPALLRHGRPVDPTRADSYYRVAPGVDRRSVRPYPRGLAMIGGDPAATTPQPASVVGWGCGRRPGVAATPPACPSGAPLDLRVTFPDCWDGRRLDSPDHVAHVAYSGRDGCPSGHPVAIPQLTLVVHYPVTGPPEGLVPATGSVLAGHADFLNAWEPAALRREVRSCLARNVVCSIPGGTFGVSKLD